MNQFFIACSKYTEGLLFEELKSLGIKQLKEKPGGVYVEGELEMAYRICLWSRIAHHIYLPILNFSARFDRELYQATQKEDWLNHIASRGSFRIDVDGKHSSIRHPHYIAQVMKDAIVDQIRNKVRVRPNIAATRPDVVIHALVRENDFTVSINLAGESLFRRGYRRLQGEAPLKETLASALLYRAKWPTCFAQKPATLIDPLCGSGTLLIEGAQMAFDMAPGLKREYFGFLGWRQHRPKIWQALLDEAKCKFEQGLQRQAIQFFGYDADPAMIHAAQINIEQLGLQDKIQLKQVALQDFDPNRLSHNPFIIMNPPYGERLRPIARSVWESFFAKLKTHGQGQLAVFTAEPEQLKGLGLAVHKHYPFFNGKLKTELLLFMLYPHSDLDYNEATLAKEET